MTGRVVFQRYGDVHHASASLAMREKVLARIFPGLCWDVTVVDNALPPDFAGETPEGWLLLGGDNSLREISGWEKGFRDLAPQEAWNPEDPVLMVNDTFHRNFDTGYLEHLPFVPVAEGVSQGALLGHVDLYPREVSLFGLAMQCWIRTSFVLGSWAVFSRLLPLTPPGDRAAIFSDAPGMLFNPHARNPLSPRYRRYLESYLLGSDSEYACRWHTVLPQGEAGWTLLRIKTLAIVCEHWLAARARRLGIPLRDVSGKFDERERCLLAMAREEEDAEDGRA